MTMEAIDPAGVLIVCGIVFLMFLFAAVTDSFGGGGGGMTL